MTSSSNGGDAGSRVSIPADLRETFQSIRDYTGKQHSDEDIFSVFEDCFNDPHETAQKLLFLDTFHEVRSKREKKKENVIVPKPQERGRNGRRNFGSNYTGANSGRNAGFKRQGGANHRIRGSGAASPAPSIASNDSSVKASKPVTPPSRFNNPKITEEHSPSKSASSSEVIAELTKSKASETVPVSDSAVQNDTQYTENGTSLSSQQSYTSAQQSATSNCGSQSDQVTTTEAASPKGNNQSLLKSDAGERPHVTFPAHLQVAKMLETGLTFGSFDSNFVKETSCDTFTFGRDDSTIKSPHGTAASGDSDRTQDKDQEFSNSAPETESDQTDHLVEGSEVDKMSEEFLPIKDTSQGANCDAPPISYHDQYSIAASQHAMNLFRQQYPLSFFPYGLYYPPFCMPQMPQPYIQQFSTPNGLQQQPYLPPQDDSPVPPGVKLHLPQIGTNIGNSPPTTFPSQYDSYAAAFNHIPSAATVDSTHKEEKKEDYITGQLSLANLQASAMYNLSLQGHPLAFPTLQAGFTGIYQQTQPILPPPTISPMNEQQPIGPPLITNQQPQAAPTNMDNNY